MSKLGTRGREALNYMPSKLVLNIDNPIIAMNNLLILHSPVL